MSRTILLALILTITLGGGLGMASPPFGGDDTGFVPPDKDAAKCENGVADQVGKLFTKFVKCVRKGATAAFKGKTFDDEECTDDVDTKFDKAVARFTCPTCVFATPEVIHDIGDQAVDNAIPVIFCAGTTPFGEEGGFVPPDKATAKCEHGAAKAYAKLATKIIKCHIKAAKTAFKGKPFDEEECEDGAQTKYDASIAKLKDCPACLDAATLGATTRSNLDSQNAQIYCAS
jgi:hypothetical protein